MLWAIVKPRAALFSRLPALCPDELRCLKKGAVHGVERRLTARVVACDEKVGAVGCGLADGF